MLSRWIFFRSGDSWFGDLAVLAFLCLQACDGVLTYLGHAYMGPGIEGNPVVAGLISAVGAGPALAAAKLLASGLGIVLHLCGAHRVLAVLTVIYLGMAVLPWTALLLVAIR